MFVFADGMAFLSFMLAVLATSVHGFGYHGNRAGSFIAKSDCSDIWPASISKISQNGGFAIKSTLIDESGGRYTPGQSYDMDLIGLISPYEGFIVQVRDHWNEDLILGSFTPLDTTKAHTIRCLGNEHGTVTHKTKDPVTIQSFIWQAPPTMEGSGEVDIVYFIMPQSFSTPQHWIKAISSAVRDTSTHHIIVERDATPVDNATANDTESDSDMEHSILIRVHSVLMVVAFSILGPIGIFFGSWMRPVMSQRALWFQLHRSFMIAMLFLATVGFICIFVAHRHAQFNNLYGLVDLDRESDDAHFALGFVVMILLIANPLISIFRCSPKDSNRWIYNLIHGILVGLPFQIIVLADSCLGVYLIAGQGPMLWIFLTYSGFTILMNIGHGFITFLFLGKDTDLPAPARMLCQFLRKGEHASKTAPPKEEVVELKETKEPITTSKQQASSNSPLPDGPSTKERVIRWFGFTVYVVITMPLLIAVIVLICKSSPD